MMDRSGNMRQRSVLFLLAALISSGAGHAIPSPAPPLVSPASDISLTTLLARAKILAHLGYANAALRKFTDLYIENGPPAMMTPAIRQEYDAAVTDFNAWRQMAKNEIIQLRSGDAARTNQWLKQKGITVKGLRDTVVSLDDAMNALEIPPRQGVDLPELPSDTANNDALFEEAKEKIESDLLDYQNVKAQVEEMERTNFDAMLPWVKEAYQGLLQNLENLKTSILSDFDAMLIYDSNNAFQWQRAQGEHFSLTEYAAYGVANTENVPDNIVSARRAFETKYLEVVRGINSVNRIFDARGVALSQGNRAVVAERNLQISSETVTLNANKALLEIAEASLKEIDVGAVYFINQYGWDHPMSDLKTVMPKVALPQQGASADPPFARSKTAAELDAYKRIEAWESKLISLDESLKVIFERGLGTSQLPTRNRNAYDQLVELADPLREELAADVETLMRSDSGTGRGSFWEWMDEQGTKWDSLYPTLDGPNYGPSIGGDEIAPAPVEGVEADFITALRIQILNNIHINSGNLVPLSAEQKIVAGTGKDNVGIYNRVAGQYNSRLNDYLRVASEGSGQISELFVKDANAMKWMTKNRVPGDVLFRKGWEPVELLPLWPDGTAPQQSPLAKLLSDIKDSISNLNEANRALVSFEGESFANLSDPGKVTYNRVVAARENVKAEVFKKYQELREEYPDRALKLLSDDVLDLDDISPSFLPVDEPAPTADVVTAREAFYRAHGRIQTLLETYNSLVESRNRLQVRRRSALGKGAEAIDEQIRQKNDNITRTQQEIDAARVKARGEAIELFEVDENGALVVMTYFRDTRLPKQLASDPAIALGQGGDAGAGGGAADPSYTSLGEYSAFDRLRFEQQGARPRGPRLAPKPRPARVPPRPSRILERSRGGRSAAEGNLMLGDPGLGGDHTSLDPRGPGGEYTSLDPRGTAPAVPARRANAREAVEELRAKFKEVQLSETKNLTESRPLAAEKPGLAQVRARAYQDFIKGDMVSGIRYAENYDTNLNILKVMRKTGMISNELREYKLLRRSLEARTPQGRMTDNGLRTMAKHVNDLPEARIDGDFYSVGVGRNADIIPYRGMKIGDMLYFRKPWLVDNTLGGFGRAVRDSQPGDIINVFLIENTKPGAPSASAPYPDRMSNPRSLIRAALRWQQDPNSGISAKFAAHQSQFDDGSVHEVKAVSEFTVDVGPGGGARTIREIRVRPRKVVNASREIYRMGGDAETHGQRMSQGELGEITEGAYGTEVAAGAGCQ